MKKEWFTRPWVEGCEQPSPFEEEVYRYWPKPIDREATLEDVVTFINDAFDALLEKGGES